MKSIYSRVLKATLLLAMLGLVACASDKVTLLPGADGSTGAVAVLSDDGGAVAVIDKPYQVANVRDGSVSTEQSDAASVSAQYGSVLEGLPPALSNYILYFQTGTTVLTDESMPKLSTLLEEVRTRPGSEVQVTGHTDTVGSLEDNDALSLQRAETVRNLLVERGLDPSLASAVGRGERELLVQTEDNVDEERNRRVEVTVR